MLKVLMSHYEATGDARVLRPDDRLLPLPCSAAARALAGKLGRGPRRGQYAGRPLALQPDRRSVLARPGRANRSADRWTGPTCRRKYAWANAQAGRPLGNMATHVVNNAQGIKTPAVFYVQTATPGTAQAGGLAIDQPDAASRPAQRHLERRRAPERHLAHQRAPSCAPWPSTCTRWKR